MLLNQRPVALDSVLWKRFQRLIKDYICALPPPSPPGRGCRSRTPQTDPGRTRPLGVRPPTLSALATGYTTPSSPNTRGWQADGAGTEQPPLSRPRPPSGVGLQDPGHTSNPLTLNTGPLPGLCPQPRDGEACPEDVLLLKVPKTKQVLRTLQLGSSVCGEHVSWILKMLCRDGTGDIDNSLGKHYQQIAAEGPE